MLCLPLNQVALSPFSRPFSPEFLHRRLGREASERLNGRFTKSNEFSEV